MQPEPADSFCLRTILLVSDNRMSDIGHMHADLIFAPGFQVHLQQREVTVALKELIVGHGVQAVSFMGTGIHFERRGFLQPGADCAFGFFDNTFHQCHIGAFLHCFFPGVLQRLLQLFAFGKHHYAGSVPVQSVHHKDTVVRVALADMLHQLAVGGKLVVFAGGDGQQSGFLLNDNQIFILMNNGQSCQFLRLDRLFLVNGYSLARMQLEIMLGHRFAVHRHLPAGEHGFDGISSAIRNGFQQKSKQLGRLGYRIRFSRCGCFGSGSRFVFKASCAGLGLNLGVHSGPHAAFGTLFGISSCIHGSILRPLIMYSSIYHEQ
ncbi:hypothetical protein D3C75_782760 [compost metagenome]